MGVGAIEEGVDFSLEQIVIEFFGESGFGGGERFVNFFGVKIIDFG